MSTPRTALVGGAASGIGRATALRLSSDGHDVVLVGRSADRLKAAEVPGSILVGDLAAPSADLLDAAARSDVLVLNAGGPPPGRIGAVSDDAWRHGLDLLLLGPLALARSALPRMARTGFGRIVFVTSTAVRQPEPDLAVSVVVRSAVTAAAKLLARDAGPGVTVNCVAPGATATARRSEILAARGVREEDEASGIPARRAADPGEIASAIAFLASDDAAYITGTVLTVDGGRTEAIW